MDSTQKAPLSYYMKWYYYVLGWFLPYVPQIRLCPSAHCPGATGGWPGWPPARFCPSGIFSRRMEGGRKMSQTLCSSTSVLRGWRRTHVWRSQLLPDGPPCLSPEVGNCFLLISFHLSEHLQIVPSLNSFQWPNCTCLCLLLGIWWHLTSSEESSFLPRLFLTCSCVYVLFHIRLRSQMRCTRLSQPHCPSQTPIAHCVGRTSCNSFSGLNHDWGPTCTHQRTRFRDWNAKKPNGELCKS